MRWVVLSKMVYGIHVLWTVSLLVSLLASLTFWPQYRWYALGILALTPLSRALFGECILTRFEVWLLRKMDPTAHYDRPFFGHFLKRFLALELPTWAFRYRLLGYTIIVLCFALRSSL